MLTIRLVTYSMFTAIVINHVIEKGFTAMKMVLIKIIWYYELA